MGAEAGSYPKISTKEENSMKFNLNHDPNNKTLAIPRAALQLSGLAGVSDLILHTDSGCIPVSYTHLTLPTICSV